MQIPKRIRYTNKYFLNPFMRLIAGKFLSPVGVIIHKGRKSGNQYKTPLIVAPVEDGFVITLIYGDDVDWYKNVLAAKECAIGWQGKTFEVAAPYDISQKVAVAAFPFYLQPFLHLANVKHNIYLRFK